MDQDALAIARAREDERRRTEAALRGFVENSADVLWIVDTVEDRLEYLSPSFERVFGEPRDRVMRGLGRWAELVHPEDRETASHALLRLLAGEKRVSQEYRIVRPDDGTVRWIRDTGFVIRDADDPADGTAAPADDARGDAPKDARVRRVGGIAQDITAARRAEERLHASEARLRLLAERIPQLVWTAVDTGKWTWAGPQWTAYTGQPSAASHGLGWLAPLHPDDREAAMTAWAGAADAGILDVEYRVRAVDGTYRWFHTRATPLAREADVEAIEWFGTSTDVHDTRELRERQAVMVAELQHRTRNLIAVVRSIAAETAAASGTLEGFEPAFEDRLAALSRVQGLLSRAGEEPITVGALVRLELDALGAELGEEKGMPNGRVRLDGPEVRLRNSVVQTLSLALHELATNARKHGAMRTRDGKLAVSWQVRAGSAEAPGRRLDLEWTESFAPRPPRDGTAERGPQSGYGRELIEHALPYTLGAETSYEIGGTGVRCLISLPLDKPRTGEGS